MVKFFLRSEKRRREMKKKICGFFVLFFLVVVANLFAIPCSGAETESSKISEKRVNTQLLFTYESPDEPWNEGELQLLQDWVSITYPVIVKVFGNPATSASINIKKDSHVAGGYSAPPEIIIGTLQMDVLVHEIIHNFNGPYGIFAGTYKEGMAVAATIEVMKSFPEQQFGNRNHGSQQDVMYEQANNESIGSAEGNFQDGFSNPGLKYVQAGYAWGKILLEDPRFLAKFNAKYYMAAAADPTLFLNLDGVRKIAKGLKATVEGKAFDNWYAQQEIFNTIPSQGLQVVYSSGNYAAMIFKRNTDNVEMKQNVVMEWSLTDCSGVILDSGQAVSAENGWVQIPVWKIASSYTGKMKLLLRAVVDGQDLHRTIALPSLINEKGIFGVADSCFGSVELGLPSNKTQSVQIVNGFFSFPFATQAGKYNIRNGTRTKVFTKDASNYFVYAP